MTDYDEFLKSKVKLAQSIGFDCKPTDCNPILKAHQRQIVSWMVTMGRCACFAAFGLGKSVIHLMTVPYRAILKRRQGIGIELSASYFTDGAAYCRAAAEELSMPSLFDVADLATA